MDKKIGNIDVRVEMTIQDSNFAPYPTMTNALNIVKSLPKEFESVDVICYHGVIRVYKESNIQDLMKISDLMHDLHHLKLKQTHEKYSDHTQH